MIKQFMLWFLIGYFGTLVIINFAKAGGPDLCEPQIIEKIVYVDRVQEIPIEIEIPRDVTRKNRISVLGGIGASNDLKTQIISPSQVRVLNEAETFLGLQYMRDFGKMNVLIQGTTNDSVSLGLGINF